MKRSLFSRFKKQAGLITLISALSFFVGDIFGQVSGIVFRDVPMNGTTLNVYGQKDANELGVEGVTVTVYPGGMSTVTAPDGTYSIPGAPVGPVRVEFSWPTMPWFKSSPDAQNQNTSVQFVTAPVMNVNFGLHNPDDYFDSVNPTVTAPIHLNGNPLIGGSSAGEITWPFWPYSDNEGVGVPSSSYAIASQTGAMWGIAYSKPNDQLFGAAVLRRHMGFGPLGIGGIYAVDNVRTAPSFSSWLDVNTLGVNVGTDPRNAADPCNALPADNNLPSYDVDAYAQAGRTGLGDIDVSEDGKTLFVVDIENKQVLGIDIATKTMKAGFPKAIPNPGCGGGGYYPWAVEEYNGKLYVGVICSGETSQNINDVTANVMEAVGGGLLQLFSPFQ